MLREVKALAQGHTGGVTDLRLKTASWASELRLANTTPLRGRDPFREQVLSVRLHAGCRVSERHGNDEQCWEQSGPGAREGSNPFCLGNQEAPQRRRHSRCVLKQEQMCDRRKAGTRAFQEPTKGTAWRRQELVLVGHETREERGHRQKPLGR